MSRPITWEEFQQRCSKFAPTFGGKKFNTQAVVGLTCPLCGSYFEAKSRAVWYGVTQSCGCLQKQVAARANPSKRTWADISGVLAERQVVLVSEVSPEDPLTKVTKPGAWRFRCRCSNEFGQTCTLKAVLSGNTTSCGCAFVSGAIASGIAKRGKYTAAQKASSVNRYSLTSGQVGEVLASVGGKLKEPIPDKVHTRWPCVCLCKCGREFTTTAQYIALRRTLYCGCTKSGIELELFDFVKNVAPDTVHNTRKVIAPYEIDVFVPGKLAIELNGMYWHQEGKEKVTMQQKHALLVAAGIPSSLFLFEDEWRERRSAVEGFIKGILGVKPKIGARKCEIQSGGTDFIDKNHIQGAGPAGTTLRLVHQGIAVAAATFVAHKSGEWNLTRYCVGENAVVGGLSRLIAAFRRAHPEPVFTFSDLRFSNGRLYEATGFQKVGAVPPRYWYFKGTKRYHRFGFRKDGLRAKGLLNKGETERECTERNGFARVWDIGKVKWRLV